MKNTIYAKIESFNETTYDTNTIRVLAEDKQGYTFRIDKNAKILIGAVYRFVVEPIVFKERDQYLVHEYTKIDELELPLAKKQVLMDVFYDFAPIDIEHVKKTLEKRIDQIQNKIIFKITKSMYEKYQDKLYLYPAATKFHHAYIGGLAYHTYTMMKLTKGFIDVYPFLNEDLLFAGVILHDILKVKELSDYLMPEYTTEGRLLGHITMAIKEIEVHAEKLNVRDSEEVMLLEHMILSHHYYPHFGSPKKTNIPEALILHFIDNIDSKMTVLQETLDQVEPGGFTSPIGVLDRERYYKAKITNKK